MPRAQRQGWGLRGRQAAHVRHVREQAASDRSENERQLRAARDYLLAVTDSIADGVLTVDAEWRLIYLNSAAEAMLGWDQEELIGRPIAEAIGIRPEQGSQDEVFVRKDGVEVEVEFTSRLIETAQGRGWVIVFRDISSRKERERELDSAIDALSWLGRVRDGLDQDRFVVYAQPILDLRSNARTQHELLIRLRDEDGSLVPPARFLPVAEEYALIKDIDAWMLRQGVELAARGAVVHINLSAQSVGDRDVLEALGIALERSGADPQNVVIELTETALLASEDEALGFVEALKRLGCRLALDDFGTGYGGFSYLKRFPVDYLKIDREFVADLANNEASRHVVEAVVSLAAGFGQRTVAEGVEDEATLELLRELGVDFAQGFHIARPAPADDVID